MKALLLSISILFLVFSYAAAPVFAQALWHRMESDSKDFSIAVPSGYQVMTDREGYESGKVLSRFPPKTRTTKIDDIKRITASEGGASFLVESYHTSNLDDALEILMFRSRPENLTDFTSGSFRGKSSTKSDGGSYVLDVIFGSKDRIYRIFGAARSENNESLKHFFSSIRLDGVAPFVLGSPLDGKIKEQEMLISRLQETPFAFEKAEKTETAPVVPVGDKMARVPGVRPQTQDPNRLFFAYKPNPSYTPKARKKGTIGTISLRVTFGAEGRIEKIVVLNELENGLTEQAVKAARLTRFLPQQEDNKPVTVEKMVQYSFSIY